MATLLYFSIFLTAISSGWHCALMCGGVASWAESHIVRVVSPKVMWIEQLLMHLCRITTYMLLGAVAGGVGTFFWRQDALPVQRFMYVMASLVLLFNASFLLWGKQKRGGVFAWGGMAMLEKTLAGLWAKNASKLGQQALIHNWPQRMMMGFFWGLIPCGLIYSVLPLAFLSGSMRSGALLMGAMGLGTLPNLLMISGFVGQLARRVAQAGHENLTRWIAAGFMAVGGLLGIYHSVTLPASFLKGGFCLT